MNESGPAIYCGPCSFPPDLSENRTRNKDKNYNKSSHKSFNIILQGNSNLSNP